jgi:xanthosine utilization system XapX-like protein
MRQSRFAYFGVFELVVAGVLAAAFGSLVVTTSPAVPLLVLAGILAVLGARVAAIELRGRRVTWRHLVAASYVSFAAMWPFIYGPDVLAGSRAAGDLFMLVLAAGNALLFAFIGFDVGRGGRHFEITPNVDRVLAL